MQGTLPDGKPCTIIVMDTEGIGAFDETAEHDINIFTLSLLISSTFIYNSVGPIDEAALTNLSLVVEVTKHI